MNKNYLKTFGLLWLGTLLFACAPTRLVKPLQKGEQVIGGNFGGPLISFGGVPLTIPYTSAFYAKGISNKTTGFGSVHLTALAFGVFQTDLGVCHQLYYQPKYKLGFTINPAVNFAIDRWEWKARVWPQLDMNVYKEFGTNKLLYAGLSNWFETNPNRPHGETQVKYWFASPQVGFMYNKNKWSYGIETKWVAPGVHNQPNVADYIGPNHMGAIGIYFQLNRKLK